MNCNIKKIAWFHIQVINGHWSITAIALLWKPTKVAAEYTLLVAIGNAPNVMATKRPYSQLALQP